MTGSWKGRGNQYIQFIRVLYCKLPTNGKQLPAFPLEAVPGIEPWPQRWEARVLTLCRRGPSNSNEACLTNIVDMLSKGEISIKPDTKVLYNNCWMHEMTKYPNWEIGIYFFELRMGSKDDKLCFVRV